MAADKADDAIVVWLPMITACARRVPHHHYDDALVDGMIAVWNGLAAFDGYGSLGGYLYSRVRWAVLDGERRRNNWRKMNRHHVVVISTETPLNNGLGDLTVVDKLTAAPVDDPEARILAARAITEIRALLAVEDRDLYDAILAGETGASYAARHGVTGSRISQRLAHIRRVAKRYHSKP